MTLFTAARTLGRHVTNFRRTIAKIADTSQFQAALDNYVFTKRGRQPYFTKDEEDFVVEYLVQRDEHGLGLPSKQVSALAMAAAEDLAKAHAQPARTVTCGKRWRRQFLKRHASRIGPYRSASITETRAAAANPEAIQAFLLLVAAEFAKRYANKEIPSPLPDSAIVWNLDELGIGASSSWSTIIGSCELRNHFKLGANEQSAQWTTVALTSRADGQSVMPMFIVHQGAGMKNCSELTASFLPMGTMLFCTESGYMDVDGFNAWVDLFMLYCGPVRPQFLFLDGHYSHLSEVGLRKLTVSNIVVFFLPAHCSHLVQPNDLGINKCFKEAYFVALEEFRIKHTAAFRMDNGVMNTCLTAALAHLKTRPDVGMSAWRKSRLYPLQLTQDPAVTATTRKLSSSFATRGLGVTMDTEQDVGCDPDVVCDPSELCLYMPTADKPRPVIIRHAVSKAISAQVRTSQELSAELGEHLRLRKSKGPSTTRGAVVADEFLKKIHYAQEEREKEARDKEASSIARKDARAKRSATMLKDASVAEALIASGKPIGQLKKDALIALAYKRGAAGVKASMKKADVLAVLQHVPTSLSAQLHMPDDEGNASEDDEDDNAMECDDDD